jgi:hypothetical protein
VPGGCLNTGTWTEVKPGKIHGSMRRAYMEKRSHGLLLQDRSAASVEKQVESPADMALI